MQRYYSVDPLHTRVLCALALHAFSGRCELTLPPHLTIRLDTVLERSLPYATRMASRSLTIPSNGQQGVSTIIITAPCVTAAALALTPVRARLLPRPHRPQRTRYTTCHTPIPNPRDGTYGKWHSCKGRLQAQYNNK